MSKLDDLLTEAIMAERVVEKRQRDMADANDALREAETASRDANLKVTKYLLDYRDNLAKDMA